MTRSESIHLVDQLEFVGNLLKGLELGIASLEDADSKKGLLAIIVAAQHTLGEAINAKLLAVSIETI